jgi:hypothetical protein
MPVPTFQEYSTVSCLELCSEQEGALQALLSFIAEEQVGSSYLAT